MPIRERLLQVKGNRSQQELAREWRMTQGNVSRILSGRQRISGRLGRLLMERYPEMSRDVLMELTGAYDDAWCSGPDEH